MAEPMRVIGWDDDDYRMGRATVQNGEAIALYKTVDGGLKVRPFHCHLGSLRRGTHLYSQGQRGRLYQRYMERADRDEFGHVIKERAREEVLVSCGNIAESLDERSAFWDAVEAAERRRDAGVQKRLVVSFPFWFDRNACVRLLERIGTTIANLSREQDPLRWHGVVHRPPAVVALEKGLQHLGDPRNIHMHMAFHDRAASYTPEGWVFAKRKIRCDKAFLYWLRQAVADACNEEMAATGTDWRYDPGSYRKLGIPKIPEKPLRASTKHRQRDGDPASVWNNAVDTGNVVVLDAVREQRRSEAVERASRYERQRSARECRQRERITRQAAALGLAVIDPRQNVGLPTHAEAQEQLNTVVANAAASLVVKGRVTPRSRDVALEMAARLQLELPSGWDAHQGVTGAAIGVLVAIDRANRGDAVPQASRDGEERNSWERAYIKERHQGARERATLTAEVANLRHRLAQAHLARREAEGEGGALQDALVTERRMAARERAVKNAGIAHLIGSTIRAHDARRVAEGERGALERALSAERKQGSRERAVVTIAVEELKRTSTLAHEGRRMAEVERHAFETALSTERKQSARERSVLTAAVATMEQKAVQAHHERRAAESACEIYRRAFTRERRQGALERAAFGARIHALQSDLTEAHHQRRAAETATEMVSEALAAERCQSRRERQVHAAERQGLHRSLARVTSQLRTSRSPGRPVPALDDTMIAELQERVRDLEATLATRSRSDAEWQHVIAQCISRNTSYPFEEKPAEKPIVPTAKSRLVNVSVLRKGLLGAAREDVTIDSAPWFNDGLNAAEGAWVPYAETLAMQLTDTKRALRQAHFANDLLIAERSLTNAEHRQELEKAERRGVQRGKREAKQLLDSGDYIQRSTVAAQVNQARTTARLEADQAHRGHVESLERELARAQAVLAAERERDTTSAMQSAAVPSETVVERVISREVEKTIVVDGQRFTMSQVADRNFLAWRQEKARADSWENAAAPIARTPEELKPLIETLAGAARKPERPQAAPEPPTLGPSNRTRKSSKGKGGPQW